MTSYKDNMKEGIPQLKGATEIANRTSESIFILENEDVNVVEILSQSNDERHVDKVKNEQAVQKEMAGSAIYSKQFDSRPEKSSINEVTEKIEDFSADNETPIRRKNKKTIFSPFSPVDEVLCEQSINDESPLFAGKRRVVMSPISSQELRNISNGKSQPSLLCSKSRLYVGKQPTPNSHKKMFKRLKKRSEMMMSDRKKLKRSKLGGRNESNARNFILDEASVSEDEAEGFDEDCENLDYYSQNSFIDDSQSSPALSSSSSRPSPIDIYRRSLLSPSLEDIGLQRMFGRRGYDTIEEEDEDDDHYGDSHFEKPKIKPRK